MYMYNVMDDILSPDAKFWLQYFHVVVFTIHLALHVFYYLTFSLLISPTQLCGYVYKNLKNKNVEYGGVNDNIYKDNLFENISWIQLP